jgi:hypothetical protein
LSAAGGRFRLPAQLVGGDDEDTVGIFVEPGDDMPAARDSRMKLGQTADGRYLQVIYVPT